MGCAVRRCAVCPLFANIRVIFPLVTPASQNRWERKIDKKVSQTARWGCGEVSVFVAALGIPVQLS